MNNRPNIHPRLDRNITKFIAIALVILFTAIAFYLRALPYKNYQMVYDNAVKLGLSDKAKYAFLNANDPWIEYWLSDYLHQHGITSWASLTRDNPATHIFWYPWGRDFTNTEHPFIPVIGALPLGSLDTVRWVSLLPPVFGALMIPVAYAYIRRRYGELAGIISALLLAVLPASSARTFAGFVEKTGIAVPFLIAGFMLYSEALRRLDARIAVAAGTVFGFIGFIWGGYSLAAVLIAVTSLLAPLAVEWKHAKNVAIVNIAIAVGFTVVLYAASLYAPVSAKYGFIAILGAVVSYATTRIIEQLQATRGIRLAMFSGPRLYATVVVALLAVGTLAAPLLGIRGRALFALAWPLRMMGKLHLSALAETVAEHSSPLARPDLFQDFVRQANIAALFTPIAALYLLYRAFRRKEAEHLPLGLAALGLYYAVMGMLYFLQVSSVIGILAIAAVIGLVTTRKTSDSPHRTRVKRTQHDSSELRMVATGALFIVILVAAIIGARTTYAMMSGQVATITGYSINAQQYGWLYMLDLLDRDTPNDTVVVAWWDYGYWISVGAHRPTLADGATINGTQIRMLAEFYTATSEDEAVKILEKLHLEPGKTLIFIHDNALYDPKNGNLAYVIGLAGFPSIDIAKSWAMLHIAGKDKMGFTVGNDKYKQTIIYKMFASAPYSFGDVGTVFPQKYLQLVGTKTIESVTLFGEKTKPIEFKHFKPYKVIISFYTDSKGRLLAVNYGGSVYYLVQVLILYKWIG
ncbi:hypothetical protein Pyrde_1121 [Pyrodictium delaneyi]|uniref:dolichyl-phosphooligosaccharide-protein glycotransferase n=1 Tax=Pyrodictium delaneyi TaxID=1273541 RepID=A0A0N7JD45_9CREN|nr:STT3 domain-containing protein [Pyrodictium delaneyi]ALL01169.1 hypothetical protein Pyrde_1121 [Pyrodictium delaneyi]OWJ55258.1 hypothetical protein Pdsh_00035 [Pyrodictium delaneyi]